jgi:hypothetical protein
VVVVTAELAPRAEQSAAVTLGLPGRANATPWVAASGSFVAIVWSSAADGKSDVMLGVSRDGGRSFAAPVRVNAEVGDVRAGGEIPPRVVLSPRGGGSDPDITVVWNAKDDVTGIKSAKSSDGGRTFAAPTSLQRPGAAGDRGWHASTFDARGTLHTIWLDHRGLAADKTGGHKGQHDGVAMAQKSSLYYSSGSAPGERELFKGVCYCCKTAMATGPKGEIYAAWRHVFAGDMRDMAFTVSRDGGRTFSRLVRVHQDNWSIAGCPDDGPAMAVDHTGTIHLVWPTVLKGAQGVIHYASSRDGLTFTPPVVVPTLGSRKPSHPQIAVDAKGRIMIAWDEVVGGVRRASARDLRRTGTGPEFGAVVPLDAKEPAMYPVLAATAQAWIAVWTTGGAAPTVRARLLSD